MRRLRRTPSQAVILAAAVCLGASGCGSELPSISAHEVAGSVLLADGKPLTSGYVFFVPRTEGAYNASAPVQPDGSFALTTLDGKAGAAPGEYAVRVEVGDDVPKKGRGKDSMPFPSKYTDEGTSGIVVKVEPRSNHLEPFKLIPNPTVRNAR